MLNLINGTTDFAAKNTNFSESVSLFFTNKHLDTVNMNPLEYSYKTLGAFAVFLTTFCLMVLLLWWLSIKGIYCFINEPVKFDVFSLLTSLPFVAFYLVVLLAATAGYARSSIMAEKLPISKMFEAELQKRTMNSASVKTKVRSGGQIRKDDTFTRALSNVISSRLPILAVIDSDQKVIGVITGNDLLRKLQNELDKNDGTPLEERLKAIKIGDCELRVPTVATENENLRQVAEKMIKEQFTKLIVVESVSSMKFVGTLDMLDLVGEILLSPGENNS